MPRRAPSPCATPGCPELTTTVRCKTHQRQAEHMWKDPAHKKIYNSRRWKALVRQVKQEQPWCAVLDCTNLTHDVDHIKPLRQILAEGGDPYDRSVVEGLCKHHHSAKTAREVWGRKG